MHSCFGRKSTKTLLKLYSYLANNKDVSVYPCFGCLLSENFSTENIIVIVRLFIFLKIDFSQEILLCYREIIVFLNIFENA